MGIALSQGGGELRPRCTTSALSLLEHIDAAMRNTIFIPNDMGVFINEEAADHRVEETVLKTYEP